MMDDVLINAECDRDRVEQDAVSRDSMIEYRDDNSKPNSPARTDDKTMLYQLLEHIMSRWCNHCTTPHYTT